jgi:hypothetical protein
MHAVYDFMAPVKRKNADAAAFISNCWAQSFRLDAVRQLSAMLTVHSYGACLQNADTGGASKEDTLPYYHFTLAFENSQVRLHCQSMQGTAGQALCSPGLKGCMQSC